jgi:hypothetical protein
VKRIRLDVELQERVARAARVLAISQPEFIRQVLRRRCDEVLGETLAVRLVSVIGIVNSAGRRADRSGTAFCDALARRQAAR